MANAYSLAAVNNEYIPPVNLELVNMVLNSKQQKYDANVAKIDAVIEAYSNADLYRDKDKKMLYDNINTVLETVNNIDKIDLSNTSLVRNIEKSFQGAITPYLGQQMANTARIRNFISEVDEKRKKGDGTYNDLNFEYSLKNARLEEYKNGEIDSIGSLEYTNYVDQNKVIVDALVPWAKEFGYDIEHSELKGEDSFYFIEETRKKLGADKVDSFISNLIKNDQNLNKQVQINSWGAYRGLSDEQFTDSYKKYLLEYSKQDIATVAELKEGQKAYVKDSNEWKQYEAEIKRLNDRASENKKLGESQDSINRRAVEFSLYSKDLINSYSSTYSYNRVESRKYNDMPMKVAKELRDREAHEWKSNEAKGLNPDGTPAGLETTHTGEGSNPEETGKTKYQEAFETYNNEFEQVRKEWSEKDPTFKKMSKAEQDAVIRANLDAKDDVVKIDGKGGSVYAVPNSINESMSRLRNASAGVTAYTDEALTAVDKMSEDMYNSFLESQKQNKDFKLDNFRGTPALKEFIKKGKTYDQLTEKEKLEVQYELSDRMILDFPDEGVATETFKVANAGIKEKLGKHGGYKRERKDLKRSGGLGTVMSGNLASVGLITSELFSQVGDMFVGITEGAEAMDKRRSSRTKNGSVSIVPYLLADNMRYAKDILTEDEDLNSLGLRDVNINGQNPLEYVKGMSSKIAQDQENRMARVMPTIRNNTKITFDWNNKAENPYTSDLSATLQARTGSMVSKDSPLSIRVDKGDYIIEGAVSEMVEVKGKMTKVFTPVSERFTKNEVSPRIQNRLGNTESNFNYSERNPNKRNLVTRVSAPPTAEKKEEVLQKTYNELLKNNSEQDAGAYIVALDESLKTSSERLTRVAGLIKTDKQRAELKELYDRDYEVKYIGSDERGYSPIISYKNSNGETVEQKFAPVPNARGVEFQMIASARFIDEHIKMQETKILNSK